MHASLYKVVCVGFELSISPSVNLSGRNAHRFRSVLALPTAITISVNSDHVRLVSFDLPEGSLVNSRYLATANPYF
jgi:hypothetical protein